MGTTSSSSTIFNHGLLVPSLLLLSNEPSNFIRRIPEWLSLDREAFKLLLLSILPVVKPHASEVPLVPSMKPPWRAFGNCSSLFTRHCHLSNGSTRSPVFHPITFDLSTVTPLPHLTHAGSYSPLLVNHGNLTLIQCPYSRSC